MKQQQQRNLSIPEIDNPIDGVNYDKTTLDQMIPQGDIQRWVNQLMTKVPDAAKYVIIPNPGIGVLIYYLLKSSERFDGVYTFATGKDKKYLQNNLKKWGLEDKVDIGDVFRPTQVASGLPESVVMLEVKDKETLEMMEVTLTLIKKAAMISIYALVEMNPLSLGFVTQFYRDQASTTDPKPVYYFLTTFEWNEKKEKEWFKNLKKYLKEFLPKFIDPKFVPKMLTDDAMEIWKLAFTTESINPTRNSEDMEMLGDGLLDYCILRHMFQRVPDINKGQVNEMKSRWVNKPFLGKLANDMDMVSHVATVKITKNVREDVFEAFIGALIYISDDLIAPGLSYVFVKNFVDYVFSPIKLGPNAEDIPTGPGKTLVPQFFGSVGLTKESVKVKQQKDEKTFMTKTIVYINDDTRRALANLGVKLNNNVLGTAEDIDPHLSEKYAYENAYDTIEAAGMTKTWVKKMSQMIMFNLPEVQPYYKTVLKKANSLGYTNIKLMSSSAQRSHNSEVAMLIGVDADGNQERIATGVGTNRNTAMADAMKKFIEE